MTDSDNVAVTGSYAASESGSDVASTLAPTNRGVSFYCH